MDWKPIFCDEECSSGEMATIHDCAERINYDTLKSTGSCNVPIRYEVPASFPGYDSEFDPTATVASTHCFTRKELCVCPEEIWILLCDGKIVPSRREVKALIKENWPHPLKPIPWDAWYL